ncbi:unnamed protein product, partial [Prorocentrum cordatum]
DAEALMGMFPQCTPSKVKRNMIFLVEAPTTVFKLVTIARKLNKGCDLDFAAPLLHHAGMLAICSWKKPGAVGYPGAVAGRQQHRRGRSGGAAGGLGQPRRAPLCQLSQGRLPKGAPGSGGSLLQEPTAAITITTLPAFSLSSPSSHLLLFVLLHEGLRPLRAPKC